MECTSEYFPPELLNWLDSILIFNKLPQESILKVMDLRLQDVAIWLKNRRIVMDVDAASKDWLACHGYSEVYGARAIARVVCSDVLFPVGSEVASGNNKVCLSRPLAWRQT